MDFLRDVYKKTGIIHHAYAIEGEKTEIAPILFKFLEKDFGMKIKNNPDFLYQEFETFTIDDSRALRELHGRRAISDSGKKVFVISTRFATTEAQNSLLKIFEEPDAGAHFFLIMPNTQVLMPTLRSRMVIVDHAMFDDELDDNLQGGSEVKSEVKNMAKRFFSASMTERLVLVKDIIEEKDKGKAIDFVTALEEILSKNVKKNELAENADALAEILLVKKYLHDRAPSVKLLLEHLCLSVTISKS